MLSMLLTHMRTTYILIMFMDKKILVILLQFTKFAKIFSPQNFVSYGIAPGTK